jgi:hypothetical protein
MIQNNYGIKKSYSVEVVPSASDVALTWMFPDIPFLRSRPITGIVLSTMNKGVNTGLTNFGYSISQSAANSSSFLTLADDQGKQFIQNMPLKELVVTTATDNATALISTNYFYGSNTNSIMFFDPRIVVWTKCYVYLPVATGTANLCCQFTVFYQ